MKWRYLVYGLIIGLLPLIVVVLLSNSHPSLSRLEATSFSDSTSVWQRNVTSITLPTEAYLFGKKIPLEVWDIRERFERELYYNCVNADQIALWYKRLKRWEPMIDSSLDANKLDRDLKYLMVAESGVRNVESIAKANGYWQFIAPTAERWRLRVDNMIDERLDPIKATGAAMRYLSKLRAQFNDYFLAAAAYNMSEDNVAAVLNYQHQSSYWNIYVNEETMRYVLRIAVIKEILEHGSHYGFRFETLTPYQPWNVRYVTVNGPIESIADWAVANDCTYKDVKIYNPWLIARSIPQGMFTIALPATDAARTTLNKGN